MPYIYLASDPLGCDLRNDLQAHIRRNHPEFEIKDLGNFDKYYEAAFKAGSLVQQSAAAGGADRAVLTCGTGMGMAIVANKFPDVYAAVVESVAAARNAAAINNANVLTLGGTIWKVDDAIAAVDAWLSTDFMEGYPQYKELLATSMQEIPVLVRTAQQALEPSAGGDREQQQQTPLLQH